MKLVLIFGPGAVGKMTVGQELAKLTNMRLFHNHKSIEFVIDVFGYFNPDAILRIRDVVFEEFVKSDNEGIIFTFMWAFDELEDWNLVKKYHDLFRVNGADVYFVELEAAQETRLKRNATENRLMNKTSKRDIKASSQRLIKEDEKHRLNSNSGEIPYENYIRINNENLSPLDAALMIKNRFSL